jgi:hypothetical protein
LNGDARDRSADHAVTQSNNHSIIGAHVGQRASVEGPISAREAWRPRNAPLDEAGEAVVRAGTAPVMQKRIIVSSPIA